MHKSKTTFALLLSSLVMLAVMPFVNMNNVSNALAQGYEEDNNYYGDSSSYSEYPTEDNKYECRTGPLEGFFVSSVEFCKLKFNDKDRNDIRDNNRTGTQGPVGPVGPAGATGSTGPQGPVGPVGPAGATGSTGPQGPVGQVGPAGATGSTGPQGPVGPVGPAGSQGIQGIQGPIGPNGTQGPSGITQLINGTNVYLVTNSSTSAGTVQAICQPGDFVLNGGYILSGTLAPSGILVSQNEPITSPSGAGWVVTLSTAFTTTLKTVHAYCFDNSP